jgi:2-C-methyl-D-erythritol 4-phosphate cytidylyltransferase/2-C-methyl-D-erythritol 2,4-cyclodiphosphate synthase
VTISPAPPVAVIVVAAGSGTRLGAGRPKAFVAIDGESVLRHALRGVDAFGPAQIVVVAPADLLHEARGEASAADRSGARVDVVAGGATRQASVVAGLAVVEPGIEIVLVHDAARALTPPEVFDRVNAAVVAGNAVVVPALPVVDTLKRVDGDTVTCAVDRTGLVAAQTPQGFRRGVLDDAYRNAVAEFTDDAALAAAAGLPVTTVVGAARAFKITTPDDLDRARTIVGGAGTSPVVPRVGIGTDVHAFGDTGTLWLAGLEWPGEAPLAGHSDGDAVAHAVVDALLSAAGLGDIGTHFGTDRVEFAGAHADAFLRRTNELLALAGWTIGNVAVQLQANRPRFAARRAEAEAALSAALGGASVTVSATTTDGLGFSGRGEGVSVTAIALVLPAS